MDIEPVAPASLPLPVKVVGSIAVVVIGFLLLKWVIGTVVFLAKVAIVLAIIGGVIYAGSRLFGGKNFEV